MFQAIPIGPLHSQWSGPNDTLNFNKAFHVQASGPDKQFGSKRSKFSRRKLMSEHKEKQFGNCCAKSLKQFEFYNRRATKRSIISL